MPTYDRIPTHTPQEESRTSLGKLKEVAVAFAPLGFVAFGGPQAHVGLLQKVFADEGGREWLSPGTFTELLALGHALPGPTSSQMVVAIAASRAGLLGALVAFVLWSLPAFTVLYLASLGASTAETELSEIWWLKGLPPAAVALVFEAAYKIGNKTCDVGLTKGIALVVALAVLVTSASPVPLHAFDVLYPALLALGGLTTYLLPLEPKEKRTQGLDVGLTTTTGGFIALIWAIVFACLSFIRFQLGTTNMYLLLAETFWRIGSVIFGGGQVVLPMLLTQVVNPGWLTEQQFYVGMALTQGGTRIWPHIDVCSS